jgi:hypothetical protein
LQRTKSYTIDLTKSRGRGEIECPKCGIRISPEDETEDAYTILETVMRKDCLDKVTLQCNNCRSQIQLVGFHLLRRIS